MPLVHGGTEDMYFAGTGKVHLKSVERCNSYRASGTSLHSRKTQDSGVDSQT